MNKTKKIIRTIWIFFISSLLLLTLMFVLIGYGFFGPMPSFEELENPKSDLASYLYSADGKVLGEYYKESRSMIQYQDLSTNLESALVATEDARFEDHPGIDIIGLFRVAFGVITLSHKGGGSTISQQLAKNLYKMRKKDAVTDPSFLEKLGTKVPFFKFKEWITAVRLEKNYTKEEILTMYLNTVDYGNLSFGIKSAAKTYFNKTPMDLNVQESALLIGMLKGPSLYNPRRHPERATERRNTVMKQMKKYGYLSQTQYDSISQLPIELDFRVKSHNVGVAQYFREFIRTTLGARKPNKEKYVRYKSYQRDSIQWETDPMYGWCNKNKKADGSNYNLYRDGLKIYSTVDYRMQTYAEQAVKKHLGETLQKEFEAEKDINPNFPFLYKKKKSEIEELKTKYIKRSERYRKLRIAKKSMDDILKIFNKPAKMTIFTWQGEKDTLMTPNDSIMHYKRLLHSAMLSMDPSNSHVKAYVGGINQKYFKYDMVKSGRRLVGSTFKPFLYTLAMKEGLDPCTKIQNVPIVFDQGDDEPYEPRFSTGSITRNSEGKMITLRYGIKHSMNQVSAWVMKRFGSNAVVRMARQLGIKSPLPAVNSLCVGVAELPLREMIAAYCTIANKGVYQEPIFITHIEDKMGNVIAEFSPISREAIDEYTAYKMIEMMKSVPNGGTGSRLRYRYNLQMPIAGKTGTTNDCSDGWFIGFTPNLVTGVWTGGDEQAICFKDGVKGQGANMALPIWALYMKSIFEDSTINMPKNDFPKPKNFNIEYNCADIEGSGTINRESDNKGNNNYIDEEEDLL